MNIYCERWLSELYIIIVFLFDCAFVVQLRGDPSTWLVNIVNPKGINYDWMGVLNHLRELEDTNGKLAFDKLIPTGWEDLIRWTSWDQKGLISTGWENLIRWENSNHNLQRLSFNYVVHYSFTFPSFTFLMSFTIRSLFPISSSFFLLCFFLIEHREISYVLLLLWHWYFFMYKV